MDMADNVSEENIRIGRGGEVGDRGFRVGLSSPPELSNMPMKEEETDELGNKSDETTASIGSDRVTTTCCLRTGSGLSDGGGGGPPTGAGSNYRHAGVSYQPVQQSDGVSIDELKSENRPPSVRRKFRTLTFGRRYKTKSNMKDPSSKKRTNGSSKGPWNFKFNYRLKRRGNGNGGGGSGAVATDVSEPNVGESPCVCTGYRRTEEHHLGAGVVFQAGAMRASSSSPSLPAPSSSSSTFSSAPSLADGIYASSDGGRNATPASPGQFSAATAASVLVSRLFSSTSSDRRQPFVPFIDLTRFIPDDYPIEDWEERARAVRARELEEGVDPPLGYRQSPADGHPSTSSTARRITNDLQMTDLAAAFQSRLTFGARLAAAASIPSAGPRQPQLQDATINGSGGASVEEALKDGTTARLILSQLAHTVSLPSYGEGVMGVGGGCSAIRPVHTQVDYIHCLVPDLLEITNCSFYWGKMDRYEAERLLEKKQEGTFLLRDSAQEEYLFSVSFRRYGRSLHARIEQWNHKFSFDSHDPGVFASDTVCGLIEHYKDPSCCMFFEPMLTLPLHRTFTFPLQHLCRSVICKATTYDGINRLKLPKPLKIYLREYHYKQRVRVWRVEVEL